jgi:hypothetical protein
VPSIESRASGPQGTLALPAHAGPPEPGTEVLGAHGHAVATGQLGQVATRPAGLPSSPALGHGVGNLPSRLCPLGRPASPHIGSLGTPVSLLRVGGLPLSRPPKSRASPKSRVPKGLMRPKESHTPYQVSCPKLYRGPLKSPAAPPQVTPLQVPRPEGSAFAHSNLPPPPSPPLSRDPSNLAPLGPRGPLTSPAPLRVSRDPSTLAPLKSRAPPPHTHPQVPRT